jgi:hypothetical protein
LFFFLGVMLDVVFIGGLGGGVVGGVLWGCSRVWGVFRVVVWYWMGVGRYCV